MPDAARRCIEALSEDFEEFEIIFVDDGSSDGSGEMLNELTEANRQVKVIHNNINLNLGVSIQRGFAVSSKEYVIFNSVDLPLEPREIKPIIEKNDKFDVLVLERRCYQGASFWRKITSRINRLLIHLLFPVASCGLKDFNFTLVCRREILALIMPIAKSPAFTQTEMILRAKYQKLLVEAVSVDYHARPAGKGALGKPHDIIWTLYDMSRFRLKRWKSIPG